METSVASSNTQATTLITKILKELMVKIGKAPLLSGTYISELVGAFASSTLSIAGTTISGALSFSGFRDVATFSFGGNEVVSGTGVFDTSVSEGPGLAGLDVVAIVGIVEGKFKLGDGVGSVVRGFVLGDTIGCDTGGGVGLGFGDGVSPWQ
jgi:hypothetical protein